jgi:hypothetical protein
MGKGAQSPPSPATEDFTVPNPTAHLTASPSAADAGQTVTLDASGSSYPAGSITAYDFDDDGNGTNEVTGSANPVRHTSYATAGTYHPTVTVHDNDGGTATATATVVVAGGGTPTPTPTATASPTPTASASPTPTASPSPTQTPTVTPTPTAAPQFVLPRSGSKGRTRFTVRCDSACTGGARLTVTRKVAKQLGLGAKRTVGKVRITLTAAGQKRYTVKLTKKALARMKARHLKRLTTTLRATATDQESQTAAKHATVKIRR